MAKGIFKPPLSKKYNLKVTQPVHLHIPGDTPLHLHLENINSDIHHNTSCCAKKTPVDFTYQAPWIPPPAKTSSGRLFSDVSSTRRVRLNQSDKQNSDQIPREDGDEKLIEVHGQDRDCQDEDNEVQDAHQLKTDFNCSDIYMEKLAGQPLSEKNNNTSSFGLEKNVTWTNEALDEYIRDLDNSVNHIARCAKNLIDSLEEVVYEGRRLSGHDLSRFLQPRDALLLHAEVAGRAGRELCRWASSTQKQQDKFLAQRLVQSQKREASLTAEVKKLRDTLDRMTVDLEDSKRQLVEQQNESIKFTTVNESMESLKSHLQRQLRLKESECSRLSTQLRVLENKLTEERATLHAKLETAESQLQEMRETKEALKRVAKAQKRRADNAEQSLVEVSQQLANRESAIAGFQAELENGRQRNRSTERQYRDVGIMWDYHVTGESRDKSPSLLAQNRLQEENDRLREVSQKCESRLHSAEQELEQLRTNLASCEGLLNEYHGDAARQANRLHVLNERLKKTEDDRERSQIQLDEVERRLREAENRNRVLESTIQTRTYLNETSMKIRENEDRMDSHKGINRLPRSETDGIRDYAPEVRSSDPSSGTVIQELRRELAETREAHERAERKAEVRLADLRAQLNQADATNRSLQAYLTFLKRSYASVFQSDVVPLFDPPGSAQVTPGATSIPAKSINDCPDGIEAPTGHGLDVTT